MAEVTPLQEAVWFDELLPTAVELAAGRYRFPTIANVKTFGSLVVDGISVDDATREAVAALRDGEAFWKR